MTLLGLVKCQVHCDKGLAYKVTNSSPWNVSEFRESKLTASTGVSSLLDIENGYHYVWDTELKHPGGGRLGELRNGSWLTIYESSHGAGGVELFTIKDSAWVAALRAELETYNNNYDGFELEAGAGLILRDCTLNIRGPGGKLVNGTGTYYFSNNRIVDNGAIAAGITAIAEDLDTPASALQNDSTVTGTTIKDALETLKGMSGGNTVFENHTINSTEESNKKFQLTLGTPDTSRGLLMIYRGSCGQTYGDDYSIIDGNWVTWSGLGLDDPDQMQDGHKLTIGFMPA